MDTKQKSSENNHKNMVIDSSATVCTEAEYVGKITLGARCVVHPKARIIAETAPIIIGDGNLIEEQACIINRSGAPMRIGNNNVFEVNCHVEAAIVGDFNVFESKSFVGPLVSVSRGCVIGAMCHVNYEEVLPENVVIYGSDHRRRVQSERPQTQSSQLDFLHRMLSNYHYVIKAGKTATPR